MKMEEKLKTIVLLTFFSVSSLLALTKKERINNFEKLYKSVKESYPFFDKKGINWEDVYKKYISNLENPMSDEEYISFLRNLMAELDDMHSKIVEPPSKLNGVGVLIEEKENKILISQVKKDSQAEAIGLKKGFEIIEVDRTPILNYIDTLPLYFKKPQFRLRFYLFHGEANTSVSIKFKNEDGNIKEVKLKREPPGSSVLKREYITLKNLGDEIGYIKISQFWGKDLIKEFDKALKFLFNTNGLIIDVRGNPGGGSEFSDLIAGRFIKWPIKIGTIINKMSRYDPNIGFRNEFAYVIQPKGKTYKNPVVILIDSLCSSACELFTISMRDSGRALLVGRKTMGAIGLAGPIKLSGGIVAQFSTGEFLRLNGISVEGIGIAPDVLVDNEDEDIEKALEMLKWEILQKK